MAGILRASVTVVKILDGLGNKRDGVAISVGSITVLIQFFQLTCIVV